MNAEADRKQEAGGFDGADRHALLAAVGDFLAKDVVPAIEDKALAFRVRIAANLLRIAIGEEIAGDPPATTDDPTDEALVAALGHKLAVVNPRFDLSEDID